MSIAQLNFENKTKDQVAIERLKMFEPPEGYFLAFSGGKDSIVIYDLAVKAGVKFDAHYRRVGVDPPELVYFIRENYKEVIEDSPHYTMWQGIYERGLPTRIRRWCCEQLKHNGGKGRFVVTGVRWAESVKRKLNRKMVETCVKRGDRVLNPIIDWSTKEVWDYIDGNKIPYCSLYDEGFKRLGCVMCPMTSKTQALIEAERWPKIAEAYRRAADRYYEKGTEGAKKFQNKEEFWDWWINRKAMKKENGQCYMFD